MNILHPIMVYDLVNTVIRIGQYRYRISSIPVYDFTSIPVYNFANTGIKFRECRCMICQYWYTISSKPATISSILVYDFVNTGEDTFSKIWASFRFKSKILKTWGGVLEICLDMGSRIKTKSILLHKFPFNCVLKGWDVPKSLQH